MIENVMPSTVRRLNVRDRTRVINGVNFERATPRFLPGDVVYDYQHPPRVGIVLFSDPGLPRYTKSFSGDGKLREAWVEYDEWKPLVVAFSVV
jgi:hypothetical protein